VPASKFRFHPAAEAELQEAAEWYEAQREGLGLDFLASVSHRISLILENPQRWRLFQGTRRVLLSPLPVRDRVSRGSVKPNRDRRPCSF